MAGWEGGGVIAVASNNFDICRLVAMDLKPRLPPKNICGCFTSEFPIFRRTRARYLPCCPTVDGSLFIILTSCCSDLSRP